MVDRCWSLDTWANGWMDRHANGVKLGPALNHIEYALPLPAYVAIDLRKLSNQPGISEHCIRASVLRDMPVHSPGYRRVLIPA